MKPLLEVSDLQTVFPTPHGLLRAVNSVSLEAALGETVGIVGESGSGKSMTGLSLLKLVPAPGYIAHGSILFDEIDVTAASERKMQSLRGGEIAMVFQDPFTSLNPVMMVGRQVAEAIELHQDVRGREAWRRAVEALAEVHLPAPESTAKRYPHQLSGGQRQRVMLAMAFACRPKLLIADEPTTALDVTLQAQILGLIKELQSKYNTTVLLISHDIGIIGAVCDRVLVMYAGRIIERGTAKQVLGNPKHPYTQGLLASLPKGSERLTPISGQPPDLSQLLPGCPFVPRCPHAMPKCSDAMPPHYEAEPGHTAACVLLEKSIISEY